MGWAGLFGVKSTAVRVLIGPKSVIGSIVLAMKFMTEAEPALLRLAAKSMSGSNRHSKLVIFRGQRITYVHGSQRCPSKVVERHMGREGQCVTFGIL
jgi:hypothetical protein